MNKQSLKEVRQLALRIAAHQKFLTEEVGNKPLLSKSDWDNIDILRDDVKKVQSVLAGLYTDLKAEMAREENPSIFMTAYATLLMSMIPILQTLQFPGSLTHAVWNGKLQLSQDGSVVNLAKSKKAPMNVPPPPPPAPKKVPVPPKNQLPPVPPPPPNKKSSGTPPQKKKVFGLFQEGKKKKKDS